MKFGSLRSKFQFSNFKDPNFCSFISNHTLQCQCQCECDSVSHGQEEIRKMLHELLLALLGYTGDLIIDEREHQNSLGIHFSPDSDEPTFKLAPDLSFIEPSERDVIERIIALGFYYRELDRFATKSRNLSWIRSANESPLSQTSELLKGKKEKQSVYRRAIANGIVEVLSVYRSAVLHIEQKLLSDSIPILATVTQGLNKFFVLLPPLYELILEIEREGICGGLLLNLLHKRCHCGVPELQTCIQRLLWHGHQVMYNQLASWMVYGILHDQHGEFFICRQEERDTEHESSHPDMLEKLAKMSTDDASLTDWHLGFHISLESSEFHKRSFECAVDSIRATTASHLWQLVVVRADLNGHLKALKDYFLLAKGDFFQVKDVQQNWFFTLNEFSGGEPSVDASTASPVNCLS